MNVGMLVTSLKTKGGTPLHNDLILHGLHLRINSLNADVTELGQILVGRRAGREMLMW
jgi:hypothetical protein